VFNKEDGALAQTRRDSWPPRFPTEEEVKYERVRLKTERLERTARLEEDIRRKRVQTINTFEYSREQSQKYSPENAEYQDHEQSSEDSGIVSFRGDEHTTPTENLTIEINLEPTTEETGSCTTVQDKEETLETVQIKAEVSEVKDKSVTDPSPRPSRAPSVGKARSVSVKSFRTQDAIPTDNVSEGPGDKPYIVAPGRKRAPKTPKKESSGCCTIL